MKVFTVSLEVTEGDTTDDVAAKLERVARAMRKQSAGVGFLDDAHACSGSLTLEGVVRGTWSVDP